MTGGVEAAPRQFYFLCQVPKAGYDHLTTSCKISFCFVTARYMPAIRARRISHAHLRSRYTSHRKSEKLHSLSIINRISLDMIRERVLHAPSYRVCLDQFPK